jgi:hypothetical protein
MNIYTAEDLKCLFLENGLKIKYYNIITMTCSVKKTLFF